MEIIIRPIYQHPIPAGTRRRVGFNPLSEADLISVTANASIGSPLYQIAYSYGWNFGMLKSASKKCNKYQELAIINQDPSVVLVPKTNGEADSFEVLTELSQVICEQNARVINFTHYGFLNGQMPKKEVSTFLNAITRLDFGNASVAFIDIDSKFFEDITAMLEEALHRMRFGKSGR